MSGVSSNEAKPTYWLTRFVFLRLLGGIYFVAFFSLSKQLAPLIGSHGLLPARLFLDRVAAGAGGRWAAFWQLPSLFWAGHSDGFLLGACYLGVALSAAVALGVTNAVVLALLWFVYMSFVHIGQVFYGYGWEILLLETGFLAIFLCPLLRWKPFPDQSPPPVIVIWLLRWVLFRVMFGAGLIKLRGDACWRDLTCLMYHYETQPIPHPLSWLLHQAPPWFHKLGVVWNHFVELVVPFAMFGPRRVAAIAGVLQVLFQVSLVLSGNLSWLNWLTLTIAVACFDDRALRRVLPSSLSLRASRRATNTAVLPWTRRAPAWALAVLVACLSVGPAINLFSPHQVMNGSFDRLHLVNTYGAFGSVGRTRYEIVLEGTTAEAIDDGTVWREYSFKCKPGDVHRRPCTITPYHYRLDWQIWFAAMSTYERQPWLMRLIALLLHNDDGALSLLDGNPFPAAPPRYLRATLYQYAFTHFGDPNGDWWTRRRVEEYFPPVSLEDPSLRDYLARVGLPVD